MSPGELTVAYRLRRRLRGLYHSWLGPVVRAAVEPARPRNADGRVLVHIGCGDQNDRRYLNVDARPMPHVHFVTDDVRLAQLDAAAVDLIYACHVLEHFPHGDVRAVLAAWHSRLRPGGVLRLSVPDFACILRIYAETHNVEDIVAPLMGGQDYDTNYHYTTFDAASLRAHLLAVGFREVRPWDPRTSPDHAFDDWAGRGHVVNGKEFPISLNLEAVR